MENAGKLQQALPRKVALTANSAGVSRSVETIVLPELPGVASFFVPGKSLELPPALVLVWRTRGPLRF